MISASELMPPRAEWTRQVGLVFLVGASRSGTTWLQSLLAGHPSICTGPETHFFRTYEPVYRAFHAKRDRPLGPAEYWTRDQFLATIEAQFWALVSQIPAPAVAPRYFLEKSPIHVVCAEFILAVFPRARFIHLIRDGRDVTASYLRISSSWGKWAPGTAVEGAELWHRRVRSGLAIPGEIAKVGGAVDRQYREVRYEALEGDSDAELTALCEWLGVEGQLRQPEGFDTIPVIGRNTNVMSEEHYPDGFVGPATDVATSSGSWSRLNHRWMVDLVAGRLLRQLGYPTGRAASWLPPAGKVRTAGVRLLRQLSRMERWARRY